VIYKKQTLIIVIYERLVPKVLEGGRNICAQSLLLFFPDEIIKIIDAYV